MEYRYASTYKSGTGTAYAYTEKAGTTYAKPTTSLSGTTMNALEDIAATTSIGDKLGTKNLQTLAEAVAIVLDAHGMTPEEITQDKYADLVNEVTKYVDLEPELVDAAAPYVLEALVPLKPIVTDIIKPGFHTPADEIRINLPPFHVPYVPIAHPGELITAEGYNALRFAVLSTAAFASAIREALLEVVRQINENEENH